MTEHKFENEVKNECAFKSDFNTHILIAAPKIIYNIIKLPFI